MFGRHRKKERTDRDERLRRIAREHVRHLSAETAAGRTDPAANGRPHRKTPPEEGTPDTAGGTGR
ncbi:hypothetical protein F0L17_02330 [Streptomyces sp. TRM43335]|uniref:Uncharacterized protein n=1 Tax=Streptomyces taklimakanensis TaxID=2569853 RepID=A0A6G2B6Y3_9ACTN|nr:hypothetical protein [Streptomyces taklimakanensis]MTE17984.1 hypothetical protein [Streptomyces taklimakanensis]